MSFDVLKAQKDAIVKRQRITAEREARLDEAQWWYDYFFGKPQSGKLGIERLQEARERLGALGGSSI